MNPHSFRKTLIECHVVAEIVNQREIVKSWFLFFVLFALSPVIILDLFDVIVYFVPWHSSPSNHHLGYVFCLFQSSYANPSCYFDTPTKSNIDTKNDGF